MQIAEAIKAPDKLARSQESWANTIHTNFTKQSLQELINQDTMK